MRPRSLPKFVRAASPPRGVARRAFTLVELLAVIAILMLLATFLLFALFGAMQEGKIARTKAQIAKLNEIVMAQYDSYQYRPIPIRISGGNLNSAQTLRLRAVRELMRLELPDRMTDVTTMNTGLLTARPALSEAYLRKKTSGWTAQYQGAECLYLIVSQAHDGFSPALDAFTDTEIGDVDGDGMKEILDGWGRPIEFLRWAPGYTCGGLKVLQQNDAAAQHDPFDIMRLETNAYALYPVVFSAGLDREYGIEMGSGSNYTSGSNLPNPYAFPTIGSTLNSYDADNYTSHSQEQR